MFGQFRKEKKLLKKTKKKLFYKRKITSANRKIIKNELYSLKKAIKNKNKQKAEELAKNLENLSEKHLKKTPIEKFFEFTVAVAIALAIAIPIRQMWFELYIIPSGSMRPTFKEKDGVLVSKSTFGVNTVGKTGHYYINPDLIQRGNTIVFSGADMDIPDVDTLYFFLIPGKKQYIKRLIGKPGDTLYFYGGSVYGIDKNGREIPVLNERFKKIEHIPFLKFEGRIAATFNPYQNAYTPLFFLQMNEPVAKLSLDPIEGLQGTMLKEASSYEDLWGFKNFATARILKKNQAEAPSEADFYLELTHSPSMTPCRILKDETGRLYPALNYDVSYIPLTPKHLNKIFSHLTTARFIVKNKKAYTYSSSLSPYSPTISIPNGTYEFDNGTAYKINPLGIASKLPSSHPIYQTAPDQIQLLYNLGIEFDTRFTPTQKLQSITPSRYAYYRSGDLYLMGEKILSKNSIPKISFTDKGAPSKKTILKNGLKIPEDMYLVLGDNHAMSADSRVFGFVPQKNLRGVAKFIFWPPGKRWGIPLQPGTPFFTLPNILVWGALLLIVLTWYAIHIYRDKKARKDN